MFGVLVLVFLAWLIFQALKTALGVVVFFLDARTEIVAEEQDNKTEEVITKMGFIVTRTKDKWVLVPTQGIAEDETTTAHIAADAASALELANTLTHA